VQLFMKFLVHGFYKFLQIRIIKDEKLKCTLSVSLCMKFVEKT
jgi:hypothetical protein